MSPLGLQLGRLHARESSQTGELMAFRDTAQCPTIEARFIFYIGPFGGIPINFIFSSPRSSVQVPVVHCFTFRKPLFQRKEALRIKFRAGWTLGCFLRVPPAGRQPSRHGRHRRERLQLAQPQHRHAGRGADGPAGGRAAHGPLLGRAPAHRLHRSGRTAMAWRSTMGRLNLVGHC